MIERFWRWLAWVLPRSLVYHAAIRLYAAAGTGRHSHEESTSIPFMDALERWRTDDR